jgi:hypothetical protein
MAEEQTSPAEIGKYLAGGGVSGVIVAALYLIYKCCNKRQFTSKCCGNEMTVGNNETPQVVAVVQPSPQSHPRPGSQQMPELCLESAVEQKHK